jgi:glucose-1-phosphate cytidylyltransferase
MKAVILAGGLGTRISEETGSRPKPMVEVGGKPILWHIMKTYSHHGINDFVICCGFRGYVIKEYFANYFLHMSDVTFDMEKNSMEVHQRNAEPWRVTIVDTGEGTMTGGRLKRVASYVGNKTFCMTYGDGVSNINIRNLVDFHYSHGKLATVTAVRPPARFGYLEITNGKVSNFSEKNQSDVGRINGGFFILEPKVLEYFDGTDEPFETGVLPLLTKRGELMAYEHNGFWKPMDTLREKLELTKLARESSNKTPPWLNF